MLNDPSKIYQVAIGMIPGIGGILTRQLVSYSGSAEKVFGMGRKKLLGIPNIGESLAEQILNQNVLKQAENELDKANKQGVKLLFYTDKEYPARLKLINDAPALLYYNGNIDLNPAKTVAIVGTRQATEYGKKITEEMILGLVSQQTVIVSGLAYGIDIAAHKAALKYGLPTFGVMASGVDIIYPSAHKNTAQAMTQQGGIITECSFGTQPDQGRFPARNRIIAGLADVVIVVEAAEKGGALITAEIANSYDKEVFAVPGNLDHKYSNGCNTLIKNHKARIYTQVSDVIEALNWDVTTNKTFTTVQEKNLSEATNDEKLVIQVLQETGGLHLDELAWKTGFTINKIAAVLLNLEFSGIVKSLPGKKYKLL